MSVGALEIMGRDRAGDPILGLDRPTREALAVYCERRWPTGRRKAIEREWDLTPDEARGIMEATASATTVDRVWKHPRGGWAVALPVLGAVIGHGVGSYFAQEARRAAHEAEQRQRDAEALAAIERAAGHAVLSLVAGGPERVRDGLADRVPGLGRERSFHPHWGLSQGLGGNDDREGIETLTRRSSGGGES